jgi:hypothetical protein
MSLNRFHVLSIAGWSFVILAALLARLGWFEQPLSALEGLVWLVLGLAPVVMLLTVFRGAASSTIAQVLYDAEQTAPSATRTKLFSKDADAGR